MAACSASADRRDRQTDRQTPPLPPWPRQPPGLSQQGGSVSLPGSPRASIALLRGWEVSSAGCLCFPLKSGAPNCTCQSVGCTVTSRLKPPASVSPLSGSIAKTIKPFIWVMFVSIPCFMPTIPGISGWSLTQLLDRCKV